MGLTDLLSRLPTGETLPTSNYNNGLAKVNKILENFTVNSVCKTKLL